LLKAVVGLDDHHLATALGGLQEAEFIHEVMPYPVPHYAFKHPLTREVAYQSQLAERRAHLHAAVAGALETLRADRLGEYASQAATSRARRPLGCSRPRRRCRRCSRSPPPGATAGGGGPSRTRRRRSCRSRTSAATAAPTARSGRIRTTRTPGR